MAWCSRTVCASLLLLTAGLSGCGGGGGSSTQKGPLTVPGIQPGQAMGGAALGATLAEIAGTLGQPTRTIAFSSPNSVAGLWPAKGLMVSFGDSNANGSIDSGETCSMIYAYAAGGRKQIPSRLSGALQEALSALIQDPTFMEYQGSTPEGVKLGSARASVRSNYGLPTTVADGIEFYFPRGIQFFFSPNDAAGVVNGIFVSSTIPASAIEPGASISPLWVGKSTFADATAILGSPTEIRSASSGMIAVWLSNGVSGVFTDTNSDGVLGSAEPCKAILAFGAYALKDGHGIGIGSSRTDVRNVYGNPESVNGQVETYPSRGILFEYDAAGSVLQIFVEAVTS